MLPKCTDDKGTPEFIDSYKECENEKFVILQSLQAQYWFDFMPNLA